MAYEVVMPYHLHMPSYFLETFTEYPYNIIEKEDYLLQAFPGFINCSSYLNKLFVSKF